MTDALKRRLAKLTADFSKKHPARAAARKFVHTLVTAKRRSAVSTRRDRERDRGTDDLSVYHGMLDDFHQVAKNRRAALYVVATIRRDGCRAGQALGPGA